ncbi:hypothetical protein BaRGS_00015887 [Batillaria attramentaria]|uniref:Uncharacterized protein n=1 Tax=Batillaria attramentaria TaxID=370345 RepID=A0ABD0L1F5_9CAEN
MEFGEAPTTSLVSYTVSNRGFPLPQAHTKNQTFYLLRKDLSACHMLNPALFIDIPRTSVLRSLDMWRCSHNIAQAVAAGERQGFLILVQLPRVLDSLPTP